MARVYRLSLSRRLLNVVIRPLIRLGLAGNRTYLLTVAGRRSGRAYSTPVKLAAHAGALWLVAPYGERQWVLNARAGGRVELCRAGRCRRAVVEEVSPADAAPVLRAYLAATPVTRPFFDASPTAPLSAFAAEAARHPVFRIAWEA